MNYINYLKGIYKLFAIISPTFNQLDQWQKQQDLQKVHCKKTYSRQVAADISTLCIQALWVKQPRGGTKV